MFKYCIYTFFWLIIIIFIVFIRRFDVGAQEFVQFNKTTLKMIAGLAVFMQNLYLPASSSHFQGWLWFIASERGLPVINHWVNVIMAFIRRKTIWPNGHFTECRLAEKVSVTKCYRLVVSCLATYLPLRGSLTQILEYCN